MSWLLLAEEALQSVLRIKFSKNMQNITGEHLVLRAPLKGCFCISTEYLLKACKLLSLSPLPIGSWSSALFWMFSFRKCIILPHSWIGLRRPVQHFTWPFWGCQGFSGIFPCRFSGWNKILQHMTGLEVLAGSLTTICMSFEISWCKLLINFESFMGVNVEIHVSCTEILKEKPYATCFYVWKKCLTCGRI